MRRFGRIAVAASLVASSAVAAADVGFAPSGAVGSWVTLLLEAGPSRRSFLRLALVGEERDSRGRDCVWMELELGEHPSFAAPLARIAVLSVRGVALSPESVSRLLVAPATEPPREVDPAQLAAWVPPQALGASIRFEGVGHQRARERIVTPAGELETWRIETRLRGALVHRAWVSARVPIVGLARLEVPSLGQRLEVFGFGGAAKRRMPWPDPNAPTIRLERAPEPRIF
jgi:hypothetical protein